jgi:hypothetical protein
MKKRQLVFLWQRVINPLRTSSFGISRSEITRRSYATRDSPLREIHEIPLSSAFGGGSRMTTFFLLRRSQYDDDVFFVTAESV